MSVDAEIARCLEQRQSFLLDAGAGAGKTYSLVQGLKALLRTERTHLKAAGQRIACITFTNVAKDEIAERIDNDSLVRVSTIHDFLWDLIAPHQRALRASVAKYNAGLKTDSRRKANQAALENALPLLQIMYADLGTNLMKGRLFHDDLLEVARLMFVDNPLLARLSVAKYPFLFIDEYQDTSKPVIEIVLGNVLPATRDRFVVGLFGDKMQNIYNGPSNPGIGEIPQEFQGELKAIVKTDNRRSPVAVINLLNKIRTDIKQVPVDNNLQGEAVYLFANGEPGLQTAMDFLREKRGWSLAPEETKQLFLTHRLIARKGGYADLIKVYGDRGGYFRDDLLGGDDRTIAFFLEKIECLVAAWKSGNHGLAITVLKNSGFRLASNDAKRAVREAIDRLTELRLSGTVRDVLVHVQQTALFPILDELAERMDSPERDTSTMDEKDADREVRDAKFFQELLALPYSQVAAFTQFFFRHTPFATKHGVKGAEFDDVIVVLDDKGASWSQYSFDKYLTGEDVTKNENRWKRTRNLFYVCCSRAKRRLAVIDLGGGQDAKAPKVRELFGPDSVMTLGS